MFGINRLRKEISKNVSIQEDIQNKEIGVQEEINVLQKESNTIQREFNGIQDLILLEHRTANNLKKIELGNSEFSDILNYPNFIKSIKLKDGEIIDLENSKFDCCNGVIYISDENSSYTVNMLELKRIYMKYNYLNLYKEIKSMEEYDIKNYIMSNNFISSNGDDIMIDIKEMNINKFLYFKEIDELYLVANDNKSINISKMLFRYAIKLDNLYNKYISSLRINNKVFYLENNNVYKKIEESYENNTDMRDIIIDNLYFFHTNKRIKAKISFSIIDYKLIYIDLDNYDVVNFLIEEYNIEKEVISNN